jgi:multidrug efflux pump subunit AcrA (membrane-fusion protein)
MEIGSPGPIQELLLVDGTKKWGQSAVAAVIASVGALALIGGTGAPLVRANSGSTPPSPTTLSAMVAKAKAELVDLGAEVQAAREAIATDKTQIAQERKQLASLLSEEYTGAPNGLLSILASPDFNSALDTQIELSQLTQSQQQLLLKLAQNVREEQASEAALQQEQKQEAVTAARLQAEEIVAEFQATAAATTQAQAKGDAASTTSPGATPTPTPTPVTTTPPGAPTPTPTPTSTPPSGTGGPFTVSTNLTLPSGISLGQIQEFLQGSPLEADASYFLQAEQTNHVSAIYLVSDAVLETGFGTSQIYLQDHNLFGFEAYTSDPGDAMQFASDQACIAYVSAFVAVNYLSPSGEFYTSYGPTPTGMNVHYATDPAWAAKIAAIGADLQSEPT